MEKIANYFMLSLFTSSQRLFETAKITNNIKSTFYVKIYKILKIATMR